MKTALITGILGQDGSFAASLLASKGYRVVGAVRPGAETTAPVPENVSKLVPWDMSDQQQMQAMLEAVRPAELYNFAAFSSGAGMFDRPVEMGDINGLAITRMLEAILKVDPTIRFCQASSSEIFARTALSPQNEAIPCCPRSPYGAAKVYANAMIDIYRRHHGLFACAAILYNHESPLRRHEFVTRKITHAAAAISLGLASELRLGNLEARRDWGYAADYVRAMWLMLQADVPGDYVIATGETHSVRELCNIAFSHVGLDYRKFVHEDGAAFRASEQVQLVGDAGLARKMLDWAPSITFEQLIRMMVDADLSNLRTL